MKSYPDSAGGPDPQHGFIGLKKLFKKHGVTRKKHRSVGTFFSNYVGKNIGL